MSQSKRGSHESLSPEECDRLVLSPPPVAFNPTKLREFLSVNRTVSAKHSLHSVDTEDGTPPPPRHASVAWSRSEFDSKFKKCKRFPHFKFYNLIRSKRLDSRLSWSLSLDPCTLLHRLSFIVHFLLSIITPFSPLYLQGMLTLNLLNFLVSKYEASVALTFSFSIWDSVKFKRFAAYMCSFFRRIRIKIDIHIQRPSGSAL